MTISCDICLNFEHIQPKQTITGSVAVASQEKCVVRHIIIEVVGTAECHWKYTKHLVKSLKVYKRGTTFSGKQDFFLSRHTLTKHAAEPITLDENGQVYPFKCYLPEYLPATWSGLHGIIGYVVKVYIKDANDVKYMFLKDAKVYPRRNLRLERHLLCEARQDVRRTFHYAIINLGVVDVSIWLPICGIAAGQSVPLVCTIKNGSKINFGGLIVVLTQIEIYRSTKPTKAVKTCRKDICRVPRMVDILRGTYEYYCLLETDSNIDPTNQFGRCKCCQVTYEVWASIQGAIPRYSAYGYPNIDTPGIPIIIGTEPLCKWDSKEVTDEVMRAIFATRPPVEMEALPPDDEVEEMLNNADEELDYETEQNLVRQLIDDNVFKSEEDDSDTASGDDAVSKGSVTTNEDTGNQDDYDRIVISKNDLVTINKEPKDEDAEKSDAEELISVTHLLY